MNYEKIYNQLIVNAYDQCMEYDSNIHDMHHIIPRCIGGGDLLDNLVPLTFKQHFIAHRLLNKIFPSSVGLAVAVNLMRGKVKYNSRQFDIVSKNTRSLMSRVVKDRQARVKGFVDYNHAARVIWETRFDDDISTGEVAQIFDFPLAYVQRCLLFWAYINDLMDVFETGKSLHKSRLFKQRRSEFSVGVENTRISNMRKTKNSTKFKQKISRQRSYGGNPGAVSVSIDGTVYDSSSRAAVILNLPVHIIRNRVKSGKYPNFKRI